MVKAIALVGLGGGFGSVLRYLISFYTHKANSSDFPLATLLVNLIGCLLIGLLLGVLDTDTSIDHNWRLLLISGFCGGYTTFSTFSLESWQMFQDDEIFLAILYISLSLVLGLFLVWLGISIAEFNK